MGIAHTPESEYAKEAVKWEAQHSMYGPPGRPYVFHEYPKRLYRAGRNAHGAPVIVDAEDVENAQQEANLLSRGFRAGGDAALEALHAQDREIATLAANRAASDQAMSPAAQAEAAAADEATSQHLPVIPETPIRHKGGRPRKVVAP